MRNRLLTLGCAALLLGGLGLALAGTVAGKDFERQGVITDAGSAYTLAWGGEEGRLRLALAPVEDALAPSAQLSLFSPDRMHLGTFTLDATWPTLDYLVEARGDYALVVHQALDASLEVLAEDDAVVTLERTKMRTETIEVVAGVHEDGLVHQFALERGSRDAHLELDLEGTAENLHAEVLNSEGVVVLTAEAALFDTQADGVLVQTLSPEDLTPGSMLVRIKAESLNGTLTLVASGFPAPVRHVFTGLPAPGHDHDHDEDDEAHEGDEVHAESHRPDHVVVTELVPGEPVAFDVTTDAVVVVTERYTAQAALFDAADRLVTFTEVGEDAEGAFVWDEEEGLYAVAIPVASEGEFVVVLFGSREGLLVLPGLTEAPAHRTLDVEALELTLGPDEEEEDEELLGLPLATIAREDSLNATVELPRGLVGFDVWASGVELEREVRLSGPDGEIATEDESSFHNEICPDAVALAGSSGEYTVEVDRSALLSDGAVEISFLHYVR